MNRTLLSLLLIGVTTSSLAQDKQRFNAKGFVLGAPVSGACPDKTVLKGKDGAVAYCDMKGILTFAKASIRNGQVLVINGKVAEISINFNLITSNKYEALMDAMVIKFGRPNIPNTDVKNFGTDFWKNDTDEMRLNPSTLVITDTAVMKPASKDALTRDM